MTPAIISSLANIKAGRCTDTSITMSFLDQIITATKDSNRKYKLERAEYERASNVLYNIAERKAKAIVLARARDGFTDATFDVMNDIVVDIATKWSVKELLYAIIFEDIPPVVTRLFYTADSPFNGFSITNQKNASGEASIFVIDWIHAMLNNPEHDTPPIKLKATIPDAPMKSNNSVVRNLFGSDIPPLTDDQIIEYLNNFYNNLSGFNSIA